MLYWETSLSPWALTSELQLWVSALNPADVRGDNKAGQNDDLETKNSTGLGKGHE